MSGREPDTQNSEGRRTKSSGSCNGLQGLNIYAVTLRNLYLAAYNYRASRRIPCLMLQCRCCSRDWRRTGMGSLWFMSSFPFPVSTFTVTWMRMLTGTTQTCGDTKPQRHSAMPRLKKGTREGRAQYRIHGRTCHGLFICCSPVSTRPALPAAHASPGSC